MKNIKFLLLIILLSFLSCTRSYDEELLIAYGDNVGNLWVCNEDGSDTRVLRSSGVNCQILDASFSSSGRYIMYVEFFTATSTYCLAIVDIDGSLVYESSPSTGMIERPRFNTDSSFIVMKGNGGGVWPAKTFLIDTATRTISDLSSTSENFIHYTAISKESGYIIDTAAQNTIQKYNLKADIKEQEWSLGTSYPLMISSSPDLSGVAFIDGDFGIKILTTADGTIRTSAGLPGMPVYFSWSPDGSTIVFIYGVNQIGFLDVETMTVPRFILTNGSGVLTTICYQFKPI